MSESRPTHKGEAETESEAFDSGSSVETAGSRLHPATLWLPSLEAVFQAAIPSLLAGWFLGPLLAIQFVACFVMLPSVLYHTIRYLTVRYQITAQELVIESGVFAHRERRVRWDRIQEIEIRQDLLYRLFSLSRVDVSTAGHERIEVRLDVIRAAEAEAVQAAADGEFSLPEAGTRLPPSSGHTAEPESTGSGTEESADVDGAGDEHCLIFLPTRELIIGGLTSTLIASLGALVSAALYFSWFVGQEDNWWSEIPEPVRNIQVREFGPNLPDEGLVGAAVEYAWNDTIEKSLALIGLGLVLSVTRYVVRYHNFRLVRNREILRKSHGLLTVHRASFSTTRVQALKIDEGLLRRWFARASIHVDSGGDRTEIGEKKKRDVFVPVILAVEARRLAAQTIPGLSAEEPAWRRVSPKAILRGSKKGWLLTLLLMAQTGLVLEWAALAWLPAFPLVYFLNRQWYRNRGYYLDATNLLSRRGWLNRETLYLPIRNIQNVELKQSFFDRRKNLATLSIDTAGQSNTGGGPVIKNLPLEEAQAMHRQLATRAAAAAPIL